ncbi:hypothetical protein GF318_05285 [Candidatus Micrarchaeota archaeon]|nr:hypothetical protein [Candidatus Micrarchaeota archaeon]
MEDTIEICSGCGKMPRPIDRLQGFFVCSRCGNRSTVTVNTDDYERVAMELDQKFHEKLLKFKATQVKKEEKPVVPKNPGKKKTAKKTTKKSAKKKAKKPEKKKTKSKKATKKKAPKTGKKPGTKTRKASRKRTSARSKSGKK